MGNQENFSKVKSYLNGNLKLLDWKTIPGTDLSSALKGYNGAKEGVNGAEEQDLCKKMLREFGTIIKGYTTKDGEPLVHLFDLHDMKRVKGEVIGTFCWKDRKFIKWPEIDQSFDTSNNNQNLMDIAEDFQIYMAFCTSSILNENYVARIESTFDILGLEYMSYKLFGKRFGFLNIDTLDEITRFTNARDDCIKEFRSKCSKHYSESLVEKFLDSVDESTIMQVFTEDLYSTREGPVSSLFESPDDQTLKDKLKITLYLLFTGTEFISNLVLWIIYNVMSNEEIRAKLFSKQINRERVVNIEYFAACFKESLRLLPTKKNLAIKINSDLDIQGFRIPANAIIVNEFELACNRDENFFNAKEFLPERWLKNGHILDSEDELKFLWENNFPYPQLVPFKEIFNLSANIISTFEMEFINFKPEINEANLIYCSDETSKVKLLKL